MRPGTQGGPITSRPGSQAGDRFAPSTAQTEDPASAPLLGTRAIVPHRLRRLTVQGEFPGWPPTTRNLERCWSGRGTLLPHFSNRTWSGGTGWTQWNPSVQKGGKGPPTHTGPRLPGGSRMDGGWSSSERAKFTRFRQPAFCWGGGGAPGVGTHRSAAVHSNRRESSGPWCSTRARGYPHQGSGRSSPPDVRGGRRWA